MQRGKSRAGTGRASKLWDILRKAGHDGPIPTSVQANDHPFIAWLADNISLDKNVPIEIDYDAAGLWQSQMKQAENNVLEQYNIDESDAPGSLTDTTQLSDQDMYDDGPSSLDDLSIEVLKERLAELQEEDKLLQGHVKDVQVLSKHMDSSLQLSRTRLRHINQNLTSVSDQLAAAKARAADVDAECTKLLDNLQDALRDLTTMVKSHATRWLILAANPAMDCFSQQDNWQSEQLRRYMHTLLPDSVSAAMQQHHTQHEAAASTSTGLAAALAGNDPSWLARNNPFGPPIEEAIPKRTDLAEHVAMREELRRLRYTYLLAEQAYIKAVAERASAFAQLEVMQRLHLQPDDPTSLGWAEEAQRNKARAELRMLQEHKDRLHTELVQMTEDVAKLQDIFVLQGDYQQKLQRQELTTERQARLVGELVGQAARHAVIKELRDDERDKLQGLYGMIQEMNKLLDDLVDAAHSRSRQYAALSAQQGGQVLSSPSRSSSSPARSMQSGRPDAYLHNLQELLDANSESLGLIGALPQSSQLRSPQSSRPGRGSTPKRSASSSQAAAQHVEGVLTHLQAGVQGALWNAMQTFSSDIPTQLQQAQAAVQRLSTMLFSSCEADPDAGKSGGSDSNARADASKQGNEIVLTHPGLAEALEKLQLGNKDLQGIINTTVVQHQEASALMEQRKQESRLERSVLTLFHLNPQALEDSVMQLEARRDAYGAKS